MGAIVDVLVAAAVLAVPLLSLLLVRTRRALARQIAFSNSLVIQLRAMSDLDGAPTAEINDDTAPMELPRD